MIELASAPSEVTFTLEITRAATGLTETVELVGHVIEPEQPEIEGAPV